MTELFFDRDIGWRASDGFFNEDQSIVHITNHVFVYLNAGKGNPWAGQTRAICERLACKKVELLSEVANFGAELPTGSENYWVLIIK